MVDLPKVPRRFVTSEAPNSSLTRADIASPYTSLARAMGEIGEGLSAIGEAGAEEAAARAVVTNPDGSVTVERPVIPFVGRAGEKFERYVKIGAVTAADTQADRALIDLRAQNPDDPDGFVKAATAFRDQHVGNLTPHIGEAGAAALRRQIDSRITQTYGGLKNEHERRALVRADHSLVARITSMDNEMVTLARKGGIGEDYQERLGNVRTLLQERVNAPNSTFTQEQADLYLDDLNTRAQGAAIHEQMERVYRERGFEAARTYLRESVTGLDGKVKQLDKIERGGLAWLRSEEAGLRGERDIISREWSTMRGQAADLDPAVLAGMEERALAVGNTRVAMDVAVTRRALESRNAVRQLPVEAQARIVGGNVDNAITQAAAKHGVDANVLRTFAHIESGRNPLARRGSYSGLFQLSEAEFQKYGGGNILDATDNANAAAAKLAAETARFQSKYGRAPEAWELYLTHQQGEGGFAAHSANPSAPAWANMASTAEGRQKGEAWAKAAIWGNLSKQDKERFGSVENVTSQQFMDVWRGRAGGTVPALPSLASSGDRADLVARQMIKKDLAADLGTILTGLEQRVARGEFANVEEVEKLGALVSVVGTPEQRRKAATVAAISEYGVAFQQKTGAERAAIISAWDERLKSGASQGESDLGAALRKADEQLTQAYKKDPYGAFYKSSREAGAQATPPVDFADPGTAAAILGLRVKQQAIIREEQGIGPFSALRPPEVEAMRGVLASGDAKATAGVFAVLGQLPDEVLAATLRDEKIKAGIVGAVHTTDPAKFNAVMSALDQWHARDPIEFPKRFGPEAWEQLKDWQANLRYMTPEQLSEERRKALDPGQAERRKKNTEEGQRLARQVSPEQVVADMGSGWWVTPSVVATNITGSQALPPVDEGTRDALMGDWINVYGRRFAATLNKDQAHKDTAEALGVKWKRSEVNGGRLMLRAPEIVYPAIDNSHGWMKPQIESAIAAQLGVGRNTIGTNALGGKVALGPGLLPIPLPVGKTNWDYTLVTDRDTETEALRYDRALPAGEGNKAPTYIVMVRDNRKVNPKWEPVLKEDGGYRRFAFDPNPEVVRATENFERARQTEAVGRARSDVTSSILTRSLDDIERERSQGAP